MRDAQQELELVRVADRIGYALLDFARSHVGRSFHADDARDYVLKAVGIVAPGSADRILRDLRQRGRIAYRCISRSQSLYVIDAVSRE